SEPGWGRSGGSRCSPAAQRTRSWRSPTTRPCSSPPKVADGERPSGWPPRAASFSTAPARAPSPSVFATSRRAALDGSVRAQAIQQREQDLRVRELAADVGLDQVENGEGAA